MGTFKAIRIDKADKRTTAALAQFDEAELMDGDVTVRVEWSTLNYKDGLAVTGFLWLSTVPPTSGLVALMFGTRWLAMLFGFAFFSHQVGGFLGVLLGGWAFEYTHSYDPVWWLSVLFGVLSALINLPIVEKPVERAVAQPA